METSDSASAALSVPSSLGAVILSAIARFGPRAALSDGDRAWTYNELGEAVARIISALRSVGVRKGDAMAMLVGNRVEQIACQYAAVLMGVRYTALHPLAAAETHVFILDDAEVSVLILDPELPASAAGGFWTKAAGVRQVMSLGPLNGALDLLELMATADPEPLADDADPAAIAYLLYTGGTTGVPKGVMLSHRALVATTILQAADWDLPAGDIRFLAATPTSHASGVIIPTILLRGGYVRLIRGFQPLAFCETVGRDGINMTFLVPSMIYTLLDAPDADLTALSCLETVVYGAAPTSPDRLVAAIARLGPVFVQLYGQTEAPMVISTLRKADHDVRRPGRIASCGLPGAAMQVKLFDADMVEVAVGEPGEICVRGPVLMDGYWKRPEATREAFRGGWLHTGDVAKRADDGFLTIVDRTKDMIISGGFNIYPREVEDALLAHPDVSAAAAFGLPSAKWGEALNAWVVLRPGATADAGALIAHVRRLRGPICAPKAIRLVPSLPLTALGKIDRKALRASSIAAASQVP